VFEILVKIKLCKAFVKKYNVALPSSITITIPGPEAADADRRRLVSHISDAVKTLISREIFVRQIN
jgi:hypothetical protein